MSANGTGELHSKQIFHTPLPRSNQTSILHDESYHSDVDFPEIVVLRVFRRSTGSLQLLHEGKERG